MPDRVTNDLMVMTWAEREAEMLRLREARGLTQHLGQRIHRMREDRRKQREIIDQTRRLVTALSARMTENGGEFDTGCDDIITEIDTLLFPEKANTPEGIERRYARLDARRPHAASVMADASAVAPA